MASQEGIMGKFIAYSSELKSLREGHQVLWKAFFRMWCKTGRIKGEFSVQVQKIDCRDLEKALIALSKVPGIKPNPLYKMYVVTKHRMLVEEHQLKMSYPMFRISTEVLDALIVLLDNQVLTEDILCSVINSATKITQD